VIGQTKIDHQAEKLIGGLREADQQQQRVKKAAVVPKDEARRQRLLARIGILDNPTCPV
jgi:hypothetical protein